MKSWPRRALCAPIPLLALALAACSSVPPLPARTATSAVTGTLGTGLGALSAASMEGAGPGQSGFRLLPTGDFALDARLALVRRAERSLDVQYYHLAKDSIGLKFLSDLGEAARRGVRVRLLVDDLYTSGEDELFCSFATIPNVEVRLFNPLPSRGGSLLGRVVASAHQFSRINLRMHNKLFIADNRFSVSGGRNLADEYFMRSNEANFIDMDVISAGPVVRELSQVFDLYWNSSLAYPIGPVMKALAPDIEATASEWRFQTLVRAAPPEIPSAGFDPLGRAAVEREFSSGRIALEYASAAVLADRPDKGALRNPGDTLSTVNRSVLEELAAAREDLLIASPYFIPGRLGMERLREVIDRKVRIRVVTNGVGSTDEPLVHWRYARYRLRMLKMGVELYEVSPTLAREVGVFGVFGLSFRRLHAKVAVFDHQRLFIGSMNFDPRSAWSNTESGLLIESTALSHQLHNLLADEHNAGVYRLRLGADGETIEWWSLGPDGKPRFTTEEPDNTWTLQLQRTLLEPLVAEELL
jgi:putative cardiolipin synthase